MKRNLIAVLCAAMLAAAAVWLWKRGEEAEIILSPVEPEMGEMEFYQARGRHLVGQSSGRAALFRCLNLTGLEFGTPYGGISLPAYPGVLGTDYFLPRQQDFQAAADNGFNCVRLPLEWARLVPAPDPRTPPAANFNLGLEEQYLGHIEEAVAMAGRAGLQVVLDLHSFGKYWAGRDEDNYNSVHCIDDAWQPQDHALRRLLERTWALLAARFADDVRVLGYDIMNEPVREELHLDYPEVCQSCNWTEIAQGVVQAVRDFDRRHLIFVEGRNFSLASHWVTENGPRAFIIDRDSAGSVLDPPGIVYSPHLYFDRDNDSRYWDMGEDDAPLGQWQDYVGERILPLIEWSLENEVPLFIGETGVPCNGEWAAVLEHVYARYFDPYRVSLALWQYADPERCPRFNDEGGRECPLNLAACPGDWQLKAAQRHPGGRYQPGQAPAPQPGPSWIYRDSRLNPWDVGLGYYGEAQVDFSAPGDLAPGAKPDSGASSVARPLPDAAGDSDGEFPEAAADESSGGRAIALRFPAQAGQYAALKFDRRWGLDVRRYGRLRFRLRLAGAGPVPDLAFYTTRPVPDCSPRQDSEYPHFEKRPRLGEYLRRPQRDRWYEVSIPLERFVDPAHPVISGLAIQNVGTQGGSVLLDDVRLSADEPSRWTW